MQTHAGVMEKLTRARSVIVPEKTIVQNNLNQFNNKEDKPLSGTEIEMVGFNSVNSFLKL
jgi:hypothetical protein